MSTGSDKIEDRGVDFIDSMRCLYILISLVIFCCHIPLSFCHPNERRGISRRDVGLARPQRGLRRGGFEGSATSTPTVQLPPINALSIRSETNTTKGQIVYRDLTYLIPSEKHVLLLRKIYCELRAAAASALNETLTVAKTTAPLAEITFRYGVISFTIGCVVGLCGIYNLLWAAFAIFDELMLTAYPLEWSLVWIGIEGYMCWAAGYFD